MPPYAALNMESDSSGNMGHDDCWRRQCGMTCTCHFQNPHAHLAKMRVLRKGWLAESCATLQLPITVHEEPLESPRAAALAQRAHIVAAISVGLSHRSTLCHRRESSAPQTKPHAAKSLAQIAQAQEDSRTTSATAVLKSVLSR